MLTHPIIGQDGLVITYNNFTNEVSYKHNGTAIINPSVGIGENIYVKIVDFNQYNYKASLEVVANQVKESTDFMGIDLTTLTDLESGPLAGLIQNAGLGELFSSFSSATATRSISKTSVVSPQIKRFNESYQKQIDDLKQIEKSLDKSLATIKKANALGSNIQIVQTDIEKLLSNSMVSPSEIKRLVQHEIEDIFLVDRGAEILNEDIISISSGEKLESLRNEYNEQINAIKNIQSNLEGLSVKINNYGEAEETNDLENKVQKLINSINENYNIESPSTPESPMNDLSITQLVELRILHKVLGGNQFEYSFPPIQVLDNNESYTIKLLIDEKSTDDNFNSGNRKTLEQQIPVVGDFKISGGIGLTFSSFFENQFTYDVRNNVITGDEVENYLPMLTSFLHFSKSTPRPTSIGVSLGIGYPILSNQSLSSISFFLGPTLLLGKSQKVLFSAGIMTGRTQQLVSDLQLGDIITEGAVGDPFIEKYNLGYFLGVSYKL